MTPTSKDSNVTKKQGKNVCVNDTGEKFVAVINETSGQLFLNFCGAQESNPRNQFRQHM
jgi:hypothetical protein